MSEVIRFELPEQRKRELRARLNDLDREREPLNREAEDIMRILGLIAVERGVE